MMYHSDQEKNILAFWEKEEIFQKSLLRNKGKTPFVFYEGPPTANGKPGIHHVLTRAYKDIILRFKTMQGYYVPRRAGWDTHGLPVELEVEKELGIDSKQEIERYGIERFITKAKESVWKYKKDWEELTRRMGFWLDMDNPYITYEKNYIESLWFIIKTFWQKGLLEEGFKVVPWCYRCGTPLSSHELAQGYKKTKDLSVFVKFKVRNVGDVGNVISNKRSDQTVPAYILSWTTTPWTLPGNVALALGPDITYSIIQDKQNNQMYILARDRLEIIKHDYTVLGEVQGKELVGLSYEPLFVVPQLQSDKSYRVYAADFVNTGEGTGVVHTAVMYGEDDYELGKRVGLPMVHSVTESGAFVEGLEGGLGGLPVKAKETEEKILTHLKAKGFLLATEAYTHDYPFCWRCGNFLLYYATKSWFVMVSRVRKKLLENNDRVNWVPDHVKHGRFGNFLEEAKDWTFSRQRYWGTPLPIWECRGCNHREVIGSLRELMEKAKPRNTFFLLRHCGAQNNQKEIVSSLPEKDEYHLTQEGVCQAETLGDILKKKGIDLIVSSPLLRTKETSEIIAKATSAPLSFDKRLREIDFGPFNGKARDEYHAFWKTSEERFTKGGLKEMENFHDLKVRVMRCIQELDEKYEGKRIALVTHGGGLWVLEGTLKGLSESEIASSFAEDFRTGEMRSITISLPLNSEGEVDLHRPFIDKISLECAKCKGDMKRVEDVVDVWFDSGAMPFAQGHWPFAQIKNERLKVKNLGRLLEKVAFPADYICEAVDQTRGWFYTLLAVSTLLDFDEPYKNVISLGHVLDEKGRKMSKSKGNVVDPMEAAKEFGMDAIRWYFFVVNPPDAPKRFDPKEIRSHKQRFIDTLLNVVSFWKLYSKRINNQESRIKNPLLLDQWIMARLQETIQSVTANLNTYAVPNAARELERFVDDLSNWYVRRSRARFQGQERDVVAGVLQYVLGETAKIAAPFTPFMAEAVYRDVSMDAGESVHLTPWPRVKRSLLRQEAIEEMDALRAIIAKALAKRAQAGIKVRTPLQRLKVKSQKSKVHEELLTLIKDEVNVKEVIMDENISDDVELDTTLTRELLEEGFIRDVIRRVQGLRKQAGLVPKDDITLFIWPEDDVIAKWKSALLEATHASSLVFTQRKAKWHDELNLGDKRIIISIDA